MVALVSVGDAVFEVILVVIVLFLLLIVLIELQMSTAAGCRR